MGGEVSWDKNIRINIFFWCCGLCGGKDRKEVAGKEEIRDGKGREERIRMKGKGG